jgi:hypothetical protein
MRVQRERRCRMRSNTAELIDAEKWAMTKCMRALRFVAA